MPKKGRAASAVPSKCAASPSPLTSIFSSCFASPPLFPSGANFSITRVPGFLRDPVLANQGPVEFACNLARFVVATSSSIDALFIREFLETFDNEIEDVVDLIQNLCFAFVFLADKSGSAPVASHTSVHSSSLPSTSSSSGATSSFSPEDGHLGLCELLDISSQSCASSVAHVNSEHSDHSDHLEVGGSQTCIPNVANAVVAPKSRNPFVAPFRWLVGSSALSRPNVSNVNPFAPPPPATSPVAPPTPPRCLATPTDAPKPRALADPSRPAKRCAVDSRPAEDEAPRGGRAGEPAIPASFPPRPSLPPTPAPVALPVCPSPPMPPPIPPDDGPAPMALEPSRHPLPPPPLDPSAPLLPTPSGPRPAGFSTPDRGKQHRRRHRRPAPVLGCVPDPARTHLLRLFDHPRRRRHKPSAPPTRGDGIGTSGLLPLPIPPSLPRIAGHPLSRIRGASRDSVLPRVLRSLADLLSVITEPRRQHPRQVVVSPSPELCPLAGSGALQPALGLASTATSLALACVAGASSLVPTRTPADSPSILPTPTNRPPTTALRHQVAAAQFVRC